MFERGKTGFLCAICLPPLSPTGDHGELTAGRGTPSTRKRNFFGGKSEGSSSHYARAGASGTRVHIADETDGHKPRPGLHDPGIAGLLSSGIVSDLDTKPATGLP